MAMSASSQRAIMWWGIAFAIVYSIAIVFLLQMVPPPDATLSAGEVGQWYADRHDEIRIGAVIASWTAAFMLPIFAVIVVQMWRVEGNSRIWTVLTVMAGAMFTIFLVLPPLFWGVAAYTEGRVQPEVTTLMHELGTLTLVTTDQYFIFAWIAIVVVSLRSTSVPSSPFPRWYGYFTLWAALIFEAGAIAFIPRTGPFAWDGLLVFWVPLSMFGAWIAVTCYLQLRAIKAQRAEPDAR